MSRFPRLPVERLLLLGGGLAVLGTALPQGTTTELIYLATVGLAGLAACTAARDAVPEAQPASRIGALAIVLYLLGDLAWWILAWRGGSPDTSIADLFYLASYAALGGMLVLLLMPLQSGRWAVDVDVLIDVVSVVVVSLLVLWELVLRDTTALTRDPTALIYPVLDAVLIGLTIRVLTCPHARRTAGVIAALALVFILAGDYGYLVAGTERTVPRATNALWMAAMLLLGWAVVRLSRLPADQVTNREPTNTSRLALAVLPMFVPPALFVGESALGREPDQWALLVAIVTLIALAFVRTERLIGSERRTLRELAAARDAALEASRAKTAFLAGISHEIRTPMNGVLGLSRLLSATPLDDQQRRYAQGIETAGESLLALLNDVLDFAKFEAGPVETESLDFDVVELVEDVAGMVAEQAHHAGLELVAHLGPDLPRWLNGDPT